MNGTSIQSTCLSINELFNNFYKVPTYQREYVWKEVQIEQFLHDVYVPLENSDFDSKKADEYFIGSMVVCPTESKVFEVIDGQQRLTTIVLLLSAIRNYFKNLDKAPSSSIENLLKNTYTDDNGEEIDQYRLSLLYPDSNRILECIVDKGDVDGIMTSKAVENIKAAFDSIDKFIKRNFSPNPNNCKRFFGYLINKVKIVKISTEDVSSALMLFETINQRGIGLNPFDLIKNRLFMHENQSSFEKITRSWRTLSDILYKMKENPLRFMRYFIISQYKLEGQFGVGNLSEAKIFKWFDENSNHIGAQEHPAEYVHELNQAARYYRGFFRRDEDHLNPGKPNYHIKNLRLLGGRAARQHLIVLLAASRLEIEEFNKIARELEKCMFVSLLIKEKSQTIESNYYHWAQKIQILNGKESLEKLLENMANDRRSKRTILSSVFLELTTNDIQKFRMKYILAKLAQHLELKAYGRIDKHLNLSNYIDSYEIEHIFPKNPSQEAAAEFGNFEVENIAERVGNLVLIEKSLNSYLGNQEYSRKRNTYCESDLLLTSNLFKKTEIGKTMIDDAVSRLQQFKTWNENSVTVRQKMLYEIAEEIWLN